MDSKSRMAMLQTKGAGAPPEEPPMAPPAMGEPEEGGMPGGMPPAEVVIPEVSMALQKLSETIQDPQKKQMVLDAVGQLQAAFPSNPSEGAGMSADAEAYGEPTPGM